MKTKHHLIITIILACITEITYAQATLQSNVRPPTAAFNGWDGTGLNPGSLEIRNNFNRPIKFFTNTSQRATIDSLGNFGVGILVPTVRLHVKDNSSLVTFFGQQTTIAGKFESENGSAEQQIAVLGESDNTADKEITS